MEGVDEEREEARFQQAIVDSREPVNIVEAYLNRKKWHKVIKRDAVARQRRDEAHLYRDEEDIRAIKSPGDPWLRIEVKGRGVAFTCRDDYPYMDIFIDRANKTSGICDWYFNLSRNRRYAAVIRGSDSDQWQVRDIFDNVRGYREPIYFCPVGLAYFIKIVEDE